MTTLERRIKLEAIFLLDYLEKKRRLRPEVARAVCSLVTRALTEELRDEQLVETLAGPAAEARATMMTYKAWDRKRKGEFPDALHLHWESFLNNRPVATWNPHTGEAWVAGFQGPLHARE